MWILDEDLLNTDGKFKLCPNCKRSGTIPSKIEDDLECPDCGAIFVGIRLPIGEVFKDGFVFNEKRKSKT